MRHIFLILILPALLSAETSDTWHVPGAAFRFSLQPSQADKPTYLNLEQLALPAPMKKQLRAFSSTGQELAVHWNSDTSEALVEAVPAGVSILAYPSDDPPSLAWEEKKHGKIPPPNRLTLHITRFKIDYRSPEGWVAFRKFKTDERLFKRQEWISAYISELLEKRLVIEAVNTTTISLATAMLEQQRKYAQNLRQRKKHQNPSFLRHLEQLKTMDNVRELGKRLKLARKELDRNNSRLRWALENYAACEATRRKEYAAHEEKIADFGREREIIEQHRRRSRSRENTRPVEAVRLEKCPFEIRSNFAAEFHGGLIVPGDGEYQFSIDSSSTALIIINGNIILSHVGDSRSNSPLNTAITLTRGLHEFNFIYHKNNAPSHARVFWKKPGQDSFTLMTENDFAPAWPPAVITVNNQAGNNFPLVSRSPQFELFTGKHSKMTVEQLSAGGNGDFRWFLDDQPVASGQSATFIIKPGSRVGIMDGSGKPSPAVLELPGTKREKPHTSPDMQLKISAPELLYDDESRDVVIEVLSALPFGGTATLERNASPWLDTLMPPSINIDIRPSDKFGNDRYSSGIAARQVLNINAAELPHQSLIDLSLSMPGLVFDRQSISLAKLDSCGKLHAGINGFVNQEGQRVIPLLHRPSPGERRRWQLPAAIRNTFSAPDKVMVVSDDFSDRELSFHNMLNAEISAKGMKAELVRWDNSRPSPIIASTAAAIWQLRQSDADTFVIIPSNIHIRIGTPLDTRIRCISAILQTIRKKNKLGRIILTATIPLPGRDADESGDNELRRVARDYGAAFVELKHLVVSDGDGMEAYRRKPEAPLLDQYPVRRIGVISEYIADKIR